VVPGCPQTSPREAGERGCIRDAYGEHRAEAGDRPEKAPKTHDKAILSPLLCLLRLFAAVLQSALDPFTSNLEKPAKATQGHLNATS
jgi:hypothetical protein